MFVKAFAVPLRLLMVKIKEFDQLKTAVKEFSHRLDKMEKSNKEAA